MVAKMRTKFKNEHKEATFKNNEDKLQDKNIKVNFDKFF